MLFLCKIPHGKSSCEGLEFICSTSAFWEFLLDVFSCTWAVNIFYFKLVCHRQYFLCLGDYLQTGIESSLSTVLQQGFRYQNASCRSWGVSAETCCVFTCEMHYSTSTLLTAHWLICVEYTEMRMGSNGRMIGFAFKLMSGNSCTSLTFSRFYRQFFIWCQCEALLMSWLTWKANKPGFALINCTIQRSIVVSCITSHLLCYLELKGACCNVICQPLVNTFNT